MIGPKGKIINAIQDDTGADITIEDDGTIYIGATGGPTAEAARAAINAIANPGASRARCALPGHGREDDQLRGVHLAHPGPRRPAARQQMKALAGGKRVANPEDVVSVGDKVQVEIAEIDPRGKISLAPVVAEARVTRRRSRRPLTAGCRRRMTCVRSAGVRVAARRHRSTHGAAERPAEY